MVNEQLYSKGGHVVLVVQDPAVADQFSAKGLKEMHPYMTWGTVP
jgi:hypothetical protein